MIFLIIALLGAQTISAVDTVMDTYHTGSKFIKEYMYHNGSHFIGDYFNKNEYLKEGAVKLGRAVSDDPALMQLGSSGAIALVKRYMGIDTYETMVPLAVYSAKDAINTIMTGNMWDLATRNSLNLGAAVLIPSTISAFTGLGFAGSLALSKFVMDNFTYSPIQSTYSPAKNTSTDGASTSILEFLTKKF